MKKQPEKPPIDDLFARKLGNMSLLPSADAFDRLQARMNQRKPKVRIVLWRNPLVQRSMAIAACLLLICLFGWQYWSADSVKLTDQVALSNEPRHSPVNPKMLQQLSKDKGQSAERITSKTRSRAVSIDPNTKEAQIVRAQPTDPKANQRSVDKAIPATTTQNSPLVAINKTTGSADKVAKDRVMAAGRLNVASTQEEPAVTIKPQEQVAQTAVKAVLISERVLTVTIAEPASLVATRTEVKPITDAQNSLAGTEKEESKAPTKIGNLLHQVKRVKSGEAFASRSTLNDERGLLDRAYNELRQTLDKDKSLKQ